MVKIKAIIFGLLVFFNSMVLFGAAGDGAASCAMTLAEAVVANHRLCIEELVRASERLTNEDFFELSEIYSQPSNPGLKEEHRRIKVGFYYYKVCLLIEAIVQDETDTIQAFVSEGVILPKVAFDRISKEGAAGLVFYKECMALPTAILNNDQGAIALFVHKGDTITPDLLKTMISKTGSRNTQKKTFFDGLNYYCLCLGLIFKDILATWTHVEDPVGDDSSDYDHCEESLFQQFGGASAVPGFLPSDGAERDENGFDVINENLCNQDDSSKGSEEQ